jgi:hypothetical protein
MLSLKFPLFQSVVLPSNLGKGEQGKKAVIGAERERRVGGRDYILRSPETSVCEK